MLKKIFKNIGRSNKLCLPKSYLLEKPARNYVRAIKRSEGEEKGGQDNFPRTRFLRVSTTLQCSISDFSNKTILVYSSMSLQASPRMR